MNEVQKLQLKTTTESALLDFQRELDHEIQLNWGKIIDTPYIKQLKSDIATIKAELIELNK